MTDDRGRMTAKYEIRSMKFETNSNDRNSKVKNFATDGAERKSKIKKQNDKLKAEKAE